MMGYQVYVVSKNGKPLMATKRFGKVRRLLKSGRAKVICRKPFTIQLLYETIEYTQKLILGIDPGGRDMEPARNHLPIWFALLLPGGVAPQLQN